MINKNPKNGRKHKMKYILMRHANDNVLDDLFYQIRDLACKNGVVLDKESILERMASLTIDSRDAYVHNEVKEIVRQREERHKEFQREHPGVQIRLLPNVLAETAKRINQRIEGQPLTIAYNDTLRTEFTARAIARVTGGNLISGKLLEANQVSHWMRNNKDYEGLSVIVTHEPAICGLLGFSEIKYCGAYFISRVENGIIKEFQEV